MFNHSYVNGADGIRLHVVTSGDSGQLILFLHGFPEFWHAWRRQLAELASDHRAVALDLRGYNASEKPNDLAAYVLPVLVEDVRQTLLQLSPGHAAVLVGHDWGGIVAWAFAAQYPELLDRLVIVNAPHPTLFARELRNNPAQRKASSYIKLLRRGGLAEKMLGAFNYSTLRKMLFSSTATPDTFSDSDREAYLQAWAKPYALTAMLNYYRANNCFDAALADPDSWRVNVPTLVLWGEGDRSFLPGNLEGLDALVPDLRVVRVPGATHWIVHEQPLLVNTTLRTFLAEAHVH